MTDDDIRTYPLGLAAEENGITVSLPWAQRQANGAVIVRVHVVSASHTAGELLLNEPDVVALDTEERPLRTQVRRFWGYGSLAEVTPAHLQTARFDVGFRLDLASTGGHCGLAISIMRTFRPGVGPKAVGGPWVFQLRVADEAEAAAAARAEAGRQEAARQESARQEAARQEAIRLDAERREAARLDRARADAVRLERLSAARPTAYAAESGDDIDAPTPRPARSAAAPQEPAQVRRSSRFLAPERAGRAGDDLYGIDATAADGDRAAANEPVRATIPAVAAGDPLAGPASGQPKRPSRTSRGAGSASTAESSVLARSSEDGEAAPPAPADVPARSRAAPRVRSRAAKPPVAE